MSDRRELYRSPNGRRMTRCESASGHAFIIHQPNAPSDGRLSHIELVSSCVMEVRAARKGASKARGVRKTRECRYDAQTRKVRALAATKGVHVGQGHDLRTAEPCYAKGGTSISVPINRNNDCCSAHR